MRILHVLPHRGGGAETYIDMLERLPGYEHERYPLSAGRSALSGVTSIPRRWSGLVSRARRADIVHVHGDMAAVLALPVIRRGQAVLTTHGLHMTRRVSGPGGLAMKRAFAAAATAARAVICTSESELSEVAAIVGGRSNAELVLIANGVDPPATLAPDARRKIRDELGVVDDEVLALFIGELEPRKAPLLAARAVNRARKSGGRIQLAVVGDGPLRHELEGFNGTGVQSLGYRTDIDRLLAAADVFVAPAEREGMSLALLAAMSHGLAIVASEGPGNPEAVGDAGLLFAVGDEEGLVAALSELVRDSGLRASLGDRAAARAHERFSSERFLAETDAVYRQAGPLTAPDRGARVPPV